MNNKGPPDGAAVGDPQDREVFPQPAAGDPDHEALEDLDPLPGSLDDLGVDADRVAGPQRGHRLLELLLLDLVDDIHIFSPCCGVPARASVRRRACACLQASISRWLPESSTSGTRRPRYSAGRG